MIHTIFFHTIIYSYDFWFIWYRFIRCTFHTTLHKSIKVLIHDLHVKICRTVWFGLIYCSHLELHKICQMVWFGLFWWELHKICQTVWFGVIWCSHLELSTPSLHFSTTMTISLVWLGVILSSQLELSTPSVHFSTTVRLYRCEGSTLIGKVIANPTATILLGILLETGP